MNRIERLAAILLLLQEKPHTSQEIARRFEISRRTALRDVQALSEMGVPVIAREGPGGGYSLPGEYRSEPLPLTGSEAFLLLLALSALQRLPDLPFRAERASLMTKLRALLPRAQLPAAEGLLANIELGVPGAGAHETRAPFLDALLEAIRQERWVVAAYQSSERPSTHHLLPRQLYTQNGFWYCRAYTHEHRQERTYRVDRIRALEPPEDGFQPLPLEESLPYQHESHPRVEARLTPRGASWAESDPHLAARMQRQPDGSVDLSFRCPPSELDWYARFFASLGSEVEVIGPAVLRRQMVELGEQLVRQYQKR